MPLETFLWRPKGNRGRLNRDHRAFTRTQEIYSAPLAYGFSAQKARRFAPGRSNAGDSPRGNVDNFGYWFGVGCELDVGNPDIGIPPPRLGMRNHPDSARDLTPPGRPRTHPERGKFDAFQFGPHPHPRRLSNAPSRAPQPPTQNYRGRFGFPVAPSGHEKPNEAEFATCPPP